MPRITCSFDWMGLEQRQVTTTIHAGHECRTRFSLKLGLGKHDDELVPFIQPETRLNCHRVRGKIIYFRVQMGAIRKRGARVRGYHRK